MCQDQNPNHNGVKPRHCARHRRCLRQILRRDPPLSLQSSLLGRTRAELLLRSNCLLSLLRAHVSPLNALYSSDLLAAAHGGSARVTPPLLHAHQRCTCSPANSCCVLFFVFFLNSVGMNARVSPAVDRVPPCSRRSTPTHYTGSAPFRREKQSLHILSRNGFLESDGWKYHPAQVRTCDLRAGTQSSELLYKHEGSAAPPLSFMCSFPVWVCIHACPQSKRYRQDVKPPSPGPTRPSSCM